ncbi:MAG: 50S ribosomal protein L25 [Candidatus Omnitrophica bacterium]|nr:50S ribosomal protein L25 [Candidatus Omnitrophota bacterium]
MEKIQLKAEVRDAVGKKPSKKVRNEGFVPAVVYKEGKETVSLKINEKELLKALNTKAGTNVLIGLKVDAGEGKSKDRTVLVKEVQHHPIKDRIIHVDFQEISLTEKLTIDVPLVTKGEAEGVVKEEGVLEHVLWEVKVECLPADIPEKIEIDVTSLKIGDSILMKDVQAPAGVKILNPPDQTVVTVKLPHVEKPVEEGVEEVVEPELIREKKEKEEAEGEEAGEAAPEAKEAKEPKKKEEKK